MDKMKPEGGPSSSSNDVLLLWNRLLNITQQTEENDFFELGGNSLKALQLLSQIETDFGVAIPLMTFVREPTLAKLQEMVRKPPATRSSSLVPLQPLGDKPPFFFVHAEAGHVYFAQNLAGSLSPDQPLYGLQSKGLDGVETPLSSATEMARHYVECLKTVQPRGPYRLGGFCTGAFLALAMANQLQESDEEVSHLAIFNTDAAWRDVSGITGGIRFHLREMRMYGPANMLRYLLTRLRFRCNRIYSNAVFQLSRLYAARGRKLPARLRYTYIGELNYRASLEFRHRYFHGTVSYFQGDPKSKDPRGYWEKASDGLEIHRVSGEWISMFYPPHVGRLASALRQSLSSPPISRSRRPRNSRLTKGQVPALR